MPLAEDQDMIQTVAPAHGPKQRKNVDIIVLASLQMDTN
jgi:hypothetical protein